MPDNRTHEQFPVLPIRSEILLPGVIAPVEVGRDMSVRAVDAAAKDDNMIFIVPQRDPELSDPAPTDLLDIGVLAEISQVIKHGPKRYTVMMRVIERRRVDEYVATRPFLIAQVSELIHHGGDSEEAENIASSLRSALAEVIAADSDDPEDARREVNDLDDLDELVDMAASHIDLERDQLVQLLGETDTLARLRLVAPIILRMHEVLRIKADINAEIHDEISRSQREKVLRDRMKAIKEELGEADEDGELDELRDRVVNAKMSDEARAAARRQISRMSNMPSSSPEYNVSRTYVETLLDIPWGITTDDTLDVSAARAILDADHAGLDKVKKRILEFIAVRKLAPDKQGPILCLVGPPGVGKTSLGRSIATSLGRKYVRAALGGVRDEAEIRGHRRTYIGALPGRIAASLKKAGSMNPVFILDEIDKLSHDHRGDPSSALLEVLDPEQNNEFVDHYLEVPLDLSRVMFLATANQLDTIPAPLLDRMEIIRVPGYTSEEKRTIALDHLVPKQKAEHGLGKDQVDITDAALDAIIGHYTREAGVRNLEREVAALCRNAAVTIAGSGDRSVVIDADTVATVLGPPRFFSEVADRAPEIGVSTGLAWTPTGGDILFIEARTMPGKGGFKLTGQMGEVMSESATAAMSWVRANAARLEIETTRIAGADVHLHVPSGAVKKDGPSAGVAITTALVSLLTGRPVRHDVAMTGELTLRGLVLPVGGIKEKVLAAHRAGIKLVILPERNRKDIIDIPENIRAELELHFAEKVDEALELALGKAAAKSDVPIPPTPPPTAGGSQDSPGQPSFSS